MKCTNDFKKLKRRKNPQLIYRLDFHFYYVLLWLEFDIVEKNTCLDHTDISSHNERLDNVDAI